MLFFFFTSQVWQTSVNSNPEQTSATMNGLLKINHPTGFGDSLPVSCLTNTHIRSRCRLAGIWLAEMHSCVCVCCKIPLPKKKKKPKRPHGPAYYPHAVTDSVQKRPNRASIQLRATGSLLLPQSLSVHPPPPPPAMKEDYSLPWQIVIHVPVQVKSDVSFRYHMFEFITMKTKSAQDISDLEAKVSF